MSSESETGSESYASFSDSDSDDLNESGSDKALQLVALNRSKDFEESLQLELDNGVLDRVLATCEDKPICIISVTGHARSGKSFLLNCIKQRLEALEDDGDDNWLSGRKVISGFEWRHGYRRTTQGIWIWSRAFIADVYGKDVAVLLLDTQGFNDETTKQDEIFAILGISLLFSSVAVVNLVSDLSEDSLDWLSPFIKYGSLCSTKEISDPFQNISFLVRDWTRLSEYAFGEKSGDKFLRKVLKTHKEGSKCTKFWEVMDCFLLPNIGSKALLKSFIGNTADLNKEFAKRLHSYIDDLTSSENLAIKKILGNEVNSQVFKHFLCAFVEMFNNTCKQDPVLKAEFIWAATVNAAEKLKLERGQDAYQQFYHQIKQRCFTEYLNASTIDGMHIQARDAALDKFQYFRLPKHEETLAERKLEQLLAEEKERLKTDNGKGATEIIVKLCHEMKRELTALFPFTPDPGVNVPSNLIFYEDDRLQQTILHISKEVKNTFMDLFGDAAQEVQSLQENIASIADEYVTKNSENMRRAESSATSVISRLREEYISKMNEILGKLPNLTVETLQVFHDLEVNGIVKKFRSLQLGNPSFQVKWLEVLLEEITEELEILGMSLESKMAETLQLMEETSASYRKTLEEKCKELELVDDIKHFHNEQFETVIRNFFLVCSYPKDSLKGEMITRKLSNSLEATYKKVIETVTKRKMEEKLQNELHSAFKFYSETLETSINENDFLEGDDFERKSHRLKTESLDLFTRQATTLSLDAQCIQLAKDTLSTKLNEIGQECKQMNEQRRTAATTQANTISDLVLDKYKLKMMGAASKWSTLEDITAESTKWKEQILKDFQEQCKSNNEDIIMSFKQKISESVEKAFSGIKEFFNQVRQTENLDFMTALFQMTTHYVENMTKHLKNKNGYFSEAELQHHHESVSKAAMVSIQPYTPISSEQKIKLEERLQETFQRFKDRNDLVFRSFQNEEPALGIDLGTTNCCIAIYINGRVKTVSTTSGYIVPSYVRMNDNDTMLFGQPAKDQAYESPESTIFDAKRILGRRIDDQDLQKDMDFWPFTIVDDDGLKIEVHGRRYYPEQISGLLLEHLKNEAETTLGFAIKKAVITVPAYFTDAQREATQRAGELAGFEVLGIMNEPTAAAVAYQLDYCYDDEKRNILVYDFGGGTFDVVVLEISKEGINVLCVNGDGHLGGEDLDRNMMTFCAEQFQETTGIDLFKDKDSSVKVKKDEARRILRRLQTRCENAKKALTTARSTVVSIDAIVGVQDLIVEVKRNKFEEMNEPYFRKTIRVVDETLRYANLRKEEIDEVVMVGGSTRIPMIQKMLQNHFNGKALTKTIDPDQAVAYGAAVQAAIKCAKPGQRLFDFDFIQEVTPMSIGIEMANKDLDVIIPKKTKIPVTMEHEYETHRDGQTTAWIRIFQGEKEKAAENKLLGEFTFEGIPAARAGVERVKISMHINLNGILNVECVCKSTKGSKKITVTQDKGIMSEETKTRLIQEARLRS